jgi:hypothetical protein
MTFVAMLFRRALLIFSLAVLPRAAAAAVRATVLARYETPSSTTSSGCFTTPYGTCPGPTPTVTQTVWSTSITTIVSTTTVPLPPRFMDAQGSIPGSSYRGKGGQSPIDIEEVLRRDAPEESLPDQPPAGTEGPISPLFLWRTTTKSTTTGMTFTVTTTVTQIFTTSSTMTVYAACATDNFVDTIVPPSLASPLPGRNGPVQNTYLGIMGLKQDVPYQIYHGIPSAYECCAMAFSIDRPAPAWVFDYGISKYRMTSPGTCWLVDATRCDNAVGQTSNEFLAVTWNGTKGTSVVGNGGCGWVKGWVKGYDHDEQQRLDDERYRKNWEEGHYGGNDDG